jgi:hypothetical protein
LFTSGNWKFSVFLSIFFSTLLLVDLSLCIWSFVLALCKMLVFFYNGISWFNTHFTLFKVQIEPFGKLSLELIYLASNGKLSLELVYLASNTLKSPSTCQKGLKNTFVTSNAFITHCLQTHIYLTDYSISTMLDKHKLHICMFSEFFEK